MSRMGATRQIKNFRHIPNLRPARFTYTGGKYVRVNQYEMSSATKGKKAVLNSAWQTAPTRQPSS